MLALVFVALHTNRSFVFISIAPTPRIIGSKKHSDEGAALFTVRVHALVVCRAWPGCYMVMPSILTQVSGKVQTQVDGAEG